MNAIKVGERFERRKNTKKDGRLAVATKEQISEASPCLFRGRPLK